MGKNKNPEAESGGDEGNWEISALSNKTFRVSDLQKAAFKTFSTERSEQDSVTGARISTTYVEREQTVVGVSKDDLEHLLSFDTREIGKFTFGMFLLSGSVWLLVEEIVRVQEFEFTTLVWVCLLCIFFGLIFVGDGFSERMRKRRIIKNIFSQTGQ